MLTAYNSHFCISQIFSTPLSCPLLQIHSSPYLSWPPNPPPTLLLPSVQCRAERGAEDRGFMVFSPEEHLIQGQRVTFNCRRGSLFPVMQPPKETHTHTHPKRSSSFSLCCLAEFPNLLSVIFSQLKCIVEWQSLSLWFTSTFSYYIFFQVSF